MEAAADTLRPGITLASAVRWIRRRLIPGPPRLLTVVTMLPDGFTGDARLAAVRGALATTSGLTTLRTSAVYGARRSCVIIHSLAGCPRRHAAALLRRGAVLMRQWRSA